MVNKVTAQHILVDHKFEADDIIRKLMLGESFEDLAKEYSNCASSKNGGNLGGFAKGIMVKPFEEVAFNLQVGEISQPVQTKFGYHIIKRLA